MEDAVHPKYIVASGQLACPLHNIFNRGLAADRNTPLHFMYSTMQLNIYLVVLVRLESICVSPNSLVYFVCNTVIDNLISNPFTLFCQLFYRLYSPGLFYFQIVKCQLIMRLRPRHQ